MYIFEINEMRSFSLPEIREDLGGGGGAKLYDIHKP